jgi:hypothetical protein
MRLAPRDFGKVPPRRQLKPPPAPVTKAPPGGEVPRPRVPLRVRDERGNELGDLFLVFRDLPRLARPTPFRLYRRRMVSRGAVR